MLQRQQEGYHQSPPEHARPHSLLRHYPITSSILLFTGSLFFLYTGFFAQNLFPILILFGSSATFMCIMLACVLGICGALTTIIGVLEHLDNRSLRTRSKVQGAKL